MARKKKYPTNAAHQAAYRQRRRRSPKAGTVMALIRSSRRDDWETPQAFYDALDAGFHFDLDAAASDTNAKCSRYFTKEDNALEQKWSGRVFVNPPYGPNLSAAFIKKASEQRNNCEVIVVLIPARTSTKWWRTYVWHDGAPAPGVTLRFPPRLRNDKPNQIGKSERRWPFPSALIIFRPDRLLSGPEPPDQRLAVEQEADVSRVSPNHAAASYARTPEHEREFPELRRPSIKTPGRLDTRRRMGLVCR